jgi:hypothetical protein
MRLERSLLQHCHLVLGVCLFAVVALVDVDVVVAVVMKVMLSTKISVVFESGECNPCTLCSCQGEGSG